MFINEVKISGRVVRDAIRNGNGPVRLSLQRGGGKKKGSDERWPTEFFDVVAWPNQLPDAEKIRKGEEILVAGRLRQNCWTKDGVNHSKVEIVASAITDAAGEIPAKATFVPAFAGAATPTSEMKPVAPNLHGIEISDADIPF